MQRKLVLGLLLATSIAVACGADIGGIVTPVQEVSARDTVQEQWEDIRDSFAALYGSRYRDNEIYQVRFPSRLALGVFAEPPSIHFF